MIPRRSAVALLACLLGGGLLAAPASARAPADPDQSQVRGGCTGGPGRISLTVSPRADDGSVRVDVVATRLPDGHRWLGLVLAYQDGDPWLWDREFRRTASGGGWAVSGELQLDEPARALSFQVIALQRGPGFGLGRMCTVSLSEPRPTFGISWCSPWVLQAMVVRRHEGGSLSVRYLQFARPDSHWHLEIRADGADGTTSVAVDGRADRRGALVTTVRLSGVEAPRFSVVARGAHGSYCSIGLDPARLGAPLPHRAEMLDALRDMRRTTHQGLRVVG
jgi:hypothetical protein